MIDHVPNITFPADSHVKISFGNDNLSKQGFPIEKFGKVLEDNYPFEFKPTLGLMRVGATFEVGIYHD